jgi:hypothetical protein
METAHLHFVRRSVPAETAARPTETEQGVFLKVPPGGRVTANGQTFINEFKEQSEEDMAISPFIIGPLNRYTIIELLSQPIFFFRTIDDLNFIDCLTKSAANKASEEELERRDPNGDVDISNVDISWSPLESQAQTLVRGESEALPLVEDEPEMLLLSQNESQMQSATLVEQRPNTFAAESVNTPQSELEYEDTWTRDGEPIESAGGYLNEMLFGPLRKRFEDIIPRVLVSINDRQKAADGFSVIAAKDCLRPGRTLITPLEHPKGTHHILLVVQLKPNTSFTLHVLDPMAWRTTREDRQAIHDNTHEILSDQNWGRNVFKSVELMTAQFPDHSYWIDCAQNTVRDEANTFTILNAWALAMGLELNPAFSIDKFSSNFTLEAQWIFDLALHDRLDWKLLYAFLTSKGYVKHPSQSTDDGKSKSGVPGKGKGKGKGKAKGVLVRGGFIQSDDSDESDDDVEQNDILPPQNRRFDLRMRSYVQLVAQQQAQEIASSTIRREMDIYSAGEETNIKLASGQAHTDLFPSDTWLPEFSDTVVRMLVGEGGWRLASTQEQLQERYDRLITPEISPKSNMRSSMVEQAPDGTAILPPSVRESRVQPPPKSPETTIPSEPVMPAPSTSLPEQVSPSLSEPHTLSLPGTSLPSQNAEQPNCASRPTLAAEKGPDTKTSAAISLSKPEPAATNTKPSSGSILSQNSTTKVQCNNLGENSHKFDPCDYFRTRVGELIKDRSVNVTLAKGSEKKGMSLISIYQSIAPVIRALNELHPPGQGFTLTESDGRVVTSEVNPPINFHDRVVLRLHSFAGRNLLLLLQFEQEEAERHATVHVLDSGSRLVPPEQREELHASIVENTAFTYDTELPGSFTWVNGPQQNATWQADYFTVLNAWTILLGLQFNTTDFSPLEDFFTDTEQIIQAVNAGLADWRLVWAYLRCINYVSNTDEPVPERRFVRTVRSVDVDEHEERLKERAPSSTESRSRANLYTPFLASKSQPESGPSIPQNRGHGNVFPNQSENVSDNSEMDALGSDDSQYDPEIDSRGSGNMVDGAGTVPNGPENATSLAEKNTPPEGGSNSKENKDLSKGRLPDNLEPEDIIQSVPTQNQSGSRTSELSQSQKDNLADGLPADFDPCEEFRRRRDEQLNTAKKRADLEDFRQRSNVTQGYGDWLRDEELLLAISAVTLAITRDQDVDHGFGFVDGPSIQWCRIEGEDVFVQPTIRPGRPMLLPIQYRSHFILLIIRMGDDGRPETFVMDSKAYHYSARRRREIHDWAYRIMRDSQWWRHIFEERNVESYRPSYTTWLPTPQQPTGDECGYYVILNAWSLALGLQPDPNANLDWSDQFFCDLLDVIHLARIGRADWLMIYSFLRCRGFVLDGHVPIDRRFETTVELRNESHQYLGNAVETQGMRDEMHFADHKHLRVRDLQNANRLNLPVGRRHDSSLAFPSDRWTEQSRVNHADELARIGKLNLNHDARELAQVARNLHNHRGIEFQNQLRSRNPNYLSESRDRLVAACQRYLHSWHDGHTLLLLSSPYRAVQETIDFYKYLFRSDFLEDLLQTEIFRDEEWPRDIDQPEVNLPLSAVVEAIDRLQSEAHERNFPGVIFTGGFSLSTSTNNSLALEIDEPLGGPASRPRRCFLMPISVGPDLLQDLATWRRRERLPRMRGSGTGHHLLAVVQEVVQESMFDVTFYDSAVHVFDGSWRFLLDRVERALRNLAWSTHRNADGRVQIVNCEVHDNVAQQARGLGWQCGPHTVINGWILAMGLTPSPNANRFKKPVYDDFKVLARAAVTGLLDWQTLVAWLFHRRLTVENAFEEVPPDRRFPMTQFWESEAQLDRHIRSIYEGTDALLASFTEEEVPYNRGNNMAHVGRAAAEKESDSGEEVEDHDTEEEEEGSVSEGDDTESSEESTSDDDDDTEALARSLEESDWKFGGRLTQYPLRKPLKSGVRDKLSFLDGYDVDEDGDVNMTEASHEGDNLAFLDGY